jgi:hypothetical protein
MRQHTLRSLRRFLIPEMILTLLLLSPFAEIAARGQGITTGGINGTVVDPAGAVLAGASLTAVNNSTNAKYTQTSRGNGEFSFQAMPLGSYTVTI